MMNNATTELFFDVSAPGGPPDRRRGRGFRYLIDGINAERILIAAECVGDGRWFVKKAHFAALTSAPCSGARSARIRASSSPSHAPYANVEAADLMRIEAADLFDRQQPCGAAANLAKLLAADASWEAPTSPSRRTAASGSPKTTTSSGSSARPVCIRWRRCRRT